MTLNVLHIETSPLGAKSVTRELGVQLLASLKAKHADIALTTRDLTASPLPHLNADILGAYFTPTDQQTDAQKSLVSASESAIAEIFAADVIVIEAPMWNFGIPSVLKAWIDHVCRAGKTFKYTETGPVGLVPNDKKVIILSSRGGVYSEGPMKSMDHQEAYLRDVLGFIGLTSVEFARAEGVSMGPDAAAKAKSSAKAQIDIFVKHAA
jgi:FMN-dependent NADH-azoreductase